MKPAIFSDNVMWDRLPSVVCCSVWEENGKRWYGGVLSDARKVRAARR